MSRFAASAAARFGGRPAGQIIPLRRKADSRRFAMLAAADEVLSVLPQPGESVHCLMTGFYDLMHAVARLIDRLGPCPTLRIATLSYNARNLAELVRLVQAGKVGTLSLLCSAFFRDHNKELFQRTREALVPSGGRVAAARNHCKVICFGYPAGERLVFEGSANLRTNRNREQLTLVRDDALHDWHAAWIDEAIGSHEHEKAEGERLTERRVGELLRIRLDGAEWWDMCEYVREKEREEGSAWFLEEGATPFSDSQIRRLLARADAEVQASHVRSRRKLVRSHLAQRRNMYAKAMQAGDVRTALACKKDEAEMLGLYPPKVVKNQLTGKGGSDLIPPEEFPDAATVARALARLSAFVVPGAGGPAGNGQPPAH